MHERQVPDWIDSYLKFTDNTEPARVFRKWAAVSTIAACLQRKVKLPWMSTVYPNFYVCLVGPTGCRKSTAMGPCKDMLTELGVRIAPQNITREALIRYMKEANDSVVDSITGESKAHCSVTVFSSELAVFVGYNNNQFISTLTDIFDCEGDVWSYMTKNCGTDHVQGVYLNICGATTPSLMKMIMPIDTGVGGGLTGRMVLVYAHGKEKSVPFPFLSVTDMELRHKLIRDLEQMLLMRGTFRVSEDFLELWEPWYVDEPIPFEDEYFRGYCERRALHSLKLSMIMSASRSNDMIIEGRDLQKAISALKEVEVKMPHVFAGFGRVDHSEMIPRISQLIARRKEIKYGMLLSHFMRDITKQELDNVLVALKASGLCRSEWRGQEEWLVYTPGKGEEQ